MISHDQHAHRILTELESDGRASQRSLSRDLGIALGLTNLLVRNLVRKGWVRVSHIKPNRVRYLLTPAGVAEKARMSRRALESNVRFYVEARDRIAERFTQLSTQLSAQLPARLSSQLPAELSSQRSAELSPQRSAQPSPQSLPEAEDTSAGAGPDKRIVFYGAGEVAEIGYICLHRTDLRLVGVVDDHVKPFFGVPVYSRGQLRPEDVGGTLYERVVVMSFGEIDDIRTTLAAQEIPADRIAWL